MSSENNVKPRVFDFGTSGTNTMLAAPGTSTSNIISPPRQDFTVAVTAYTNLVTTTASTTASSTAAASVVLQGSNDNVGWFGISSASASSTQMTTCTGTAQTQTAIAAAGVNNVSQRYAYMRAVVAVTGTGSAQAIAGF